MTMKVQEEIGIPYQCEYNDMGQTWVPPRMDDSDSW
jgi:hypothetical protein